MMKEQLVVDFGLDVSHLCRPLAERHDEDVSYLTESNVVVGSQPDKVSAWQNSLPRYFTLIESSSNRSQTISVKFWIKYLNIMIYINGDNDGNTFIHFT